MASFKNLTALEAKLPQPSTGPAGQDDGWISTSTDDTFFTKYNLDPTRWDKVFPYRLVVIDVSKKGNNGVVSGNIGTLNSGFTTKFSPMHNGFSFELANTQSSEWSFTLPITPQQLSIQDLYAVNGTATARGVTEEHNGVKFKIITAKGTMGVRPNRETIGMESGQSNLQTIFSGTLQSAKNIGNTIRGFKQIVQGRIGDESSLSDDDLRKTGYYQAMLMGQFLERYAEAKKNPKNKHWRLCFDIPKQNKSFIVIPEAFSLKQSNMRPNQMLWDIKLRAYARVTISGNKFVQAPNLFAQNDYQKLMSTIRQTRKIMSSSVDLIKAVRSDFRKPFEALRQVSLAIKDVAGLVLTVADLPNSIIKDASNSIEQSVLNFFDAASLFSKTNISDFFKSSDQEDITKAVVGMIYIKHKDSENGNIKLKDDETEPLNKIKEEPEKYFGFYDSVDVGGLELTPEQEQKITDTQEESAFINIDNLNEHKATISDLHSAISSNMGTGDTTYSQVYNKPTPKEFTTEPNLDDLELLQSLMESIQVIDDLTATKSFDNSKKTDSLEFVSNLANNAGIEFTLPQGKKLVPVPFGLTMEEISARYLKDPNRWIEISAINNLRSPYIDEDGFMYNLLSNAEGRQFNVDDSSSQLFVGQKLTLRSNTVPSFIRTITEIEKIGDNNFLITVDGEADLNKLKATDNASMQAYLPGTTNSQNRIYIPVNATSGDEDNTFEIPSLENTQINKLAKVDWLLDENGDIALNSIGDVRLSTGMTNLIQAAKLKLNTRRGTLLAHLDYGISTSVAASLADIDNGQILSEIDNLFALDPRFEGLDNAEVVLDGNTLSINLTVKIAGGNGVIPIGFNVN